MADDEANEAMAPEQPWTVVQNVSGRTRTVFEGPEAEARTYLEAHFPRVHVEPGAGDSAQADATLVSPDGAEETYHGPETGYVSDEDAASDKGEEE